MAGEISRTREARALAEEALVRLVIGSGAQGQALVVIGGLTPDTLVRDDATPHLGTVDVDILVEVGFIYDRGDMDFRWLERALIGSGFERLSDEVKWRWVVKIDGVPIVLEILCDAYDNRGQEISLAGSALVTAMNLAGPGPAHDNSTTHELPIPPALRPSAGGDETVSVRFADLGAYLLAKATAAVSRAKPKDFYDLGYVILYNAAGGPRAAGLAAAAALPPPDARLHDHVEDFTAAMSQFGVATSEAAEVFASEMSRAGDRTEPAVLEQDVIAAAEICLTAFRAGLKLQSRRRAGRIRQDL